VKKVYIINKGGHDFEDAARFGDLVYLSEGRISPFAITNMYRTFSEYIGGSSSEDFILLTGLPVMQAIACSMFAWMHGRLNLLLFKDGRYITRTVLMSELLEGGNTDGKVPGVREKADSS